MTETERREALDRWQVDLAAGRTRLYRAPTPRERERGPAVWRAAQGWPAARVAEALGRDPHPIGEWLAAFRRNGPAVLACVQTGGSPPP